MNALLTRAAALATLLLAPAAASPYPLDGYDDTGIARLAGSLGNPPGGRWPGAAIRLHLVEHPELEFDAKPEDPVLSQALAQLLKNRDPSYSMVIVDYTDPADVRWAGLRGDIRQNPGSVGKLVCMLGLFHALAGAFPDVADRKRLLRDTVVPGGDWVLYGEHRIPRYDPVGGINQHSTLRADDRFRLSEWIDHAISASANGAGSVIWREAMLIRHFGRDYPVTDAVADEFFRTTPKATLAALGRAVVDEPVRAAGLDLEALRQGSFFSPVGKRMVPGTTSYATPRELARFLFRMEQGRLVDPWSSLEMKKYAYVTKRRYRYVYPPELHTSAVFFKSGSLYQCQPEEGFRCRKYMGNVRNMMNSATVVESPPDDPRPRRYIATLMSNVLRTNSAWDHSRIAAAIHEMVAERRAVALREQATEAELEAVGKSE